MSVAGLQFAYQYMFGIAHMLFPPLKLLYPDYNADRFICDQQLQCHPDADCPFNGTFVCKCKDGYTGDGTTCRKNVCEVDSCPPSTNCIELIEPGYRCECQGYAKEDEVGGSQCYTNSLVTIRCAATDQDHEDLRIEHMKEPEKVNMGTALMISDRFALIARSLAKEILKRTDIGCEARKFGESRSVVGIHQHAKEEKVTAWSVVELNVIYLLEIDAKFQRGVHVALPPESLPRRIINGTYISGKIPILSTEACRESITSHLGYVYKEKMNQINCIKRKCDDTTYVPDFLVIVYKGFETVVGAPNVGICEDGFEYFTHVSSFRSFIDAVVATITCLDEGSYECFESEDGTIKSCCMREV